MVYKYILALQHRRAFGTFEAPDVPGGAEREQCLAGLQVLAAAGAR